MGSLLVTRLQETLQRMLGPTTCLLAEAVQGPASSPRKVVDFFLKNGFVESNEAGEILDQYYKGQELHFYEQYYPTFDPSNTSHVQEAQAFWLAEWQTEFPLQNEMRAATAFTWNVTRGKYQLIWRPPALKP